MTNCPHCLSEEMVCRVAWETGIEEEYFCTNCETTHVRHDGLSASIYNEDQFTVEDLLNIYAQREIK